MTARTLAQTTLNLLLITLAALAAWSGSSASEPLSLKESIGRLNHAGFRTRAHCSAFSVAGRGVVTAAHCLPDIETDTVHVLLAYDRGDFSQHVQMPGRSFRQIRDKDLAVLCDETGQQTGLSVSEPKLEPGQPVVVRGYGVPKVHLQHAYSCSVKAVSEQGIGTLDCPLPPGMSGAPILTAEDQKVIGMVAASGRSRSVFSRVDTEILERVCG